MLLGTQKAIGTIYIIIDAQYNQCALGVFFQSSPHSSLQNTAVTRFLKIEAIARWIAVHNIDVQYKK